MKVSLFKNSIVVALGLVVMGFLAYAATLQSPFLASEVNTILEDPTIQDFSKVNEYYPDRSDFQRLVSQAILCD